MPLAGGSFELRNRSERLANNNLGIISGGDKGRSIGVNRRADLDTVDMYLDSAQYDHLVSWNATDACDQPYPLRERKPKIIYNLPQRIQKQVASKLMGPRVFPSLNIEQDELTEMLIKHLIKLTGFKAKAMSASAYLPSHGSAFMRFKISAGFPLIEIYNPNHCYPKFDVTGQLESVEIKYVYEDVDDRDEHGNPKKKWFRLFIGKMKDVLYDNPEFSAEHDPEFQVKKTADHELGFVQGEWIKVGDDPHLPDGPSLITETLGFFDAFNYSLSQSDQAVQYNQEPQLFFKNMDQEEMEDLVKSSMSSWSLGREGEAGYLETSMTGVTIADQLRDKYRQSISDITRVTLLDPEKLVGSAQSAKAMEVLHGPLLDLIDELRPYMEKGIIGFLQKLTLAVVITARKGFDLNGITLPPNFDIQSLDIEALWPAVFPMTMSDLQQKIALTSQATQANLISRKTGTKYIAKDFGIEDVDEELNEVNTQEQLGGFGFF